MNTTRNRRTQRRVNLTASEPGWIQFAIPYLRQALVVVLFVSGLVVMGRLNRIEKRTMANAAKLAKKAAIAERQPAVATVKHALLNQLKLMKSVESVTEVGKTELAVTLRSDMLFRIGSATLDESAEREITAMVATLDSAKTQLRVEIEGHTDTSPIVMNKARFHSNWDLSSARASRIVPIFEDAGYRKTQLRAVGLADSHPETTTGDQSQNRRIVLRISEDRST